MKKILCIGALLFIVFGAWAQTRVACVGNSITYGYLLKDRQTNCYPSRLGVMLGERYEVGNFGRSGATLLEKGHNPYVKTAEYGAALEFAPDVVVIHLGINDTDPRDFPQFRDEFLGDYLRLIDSFRAKNPKVRFIVARMTPISHRHIRFKYGTRDWYNAIQAQIELVADSAKVQLIDFQDLLYSRPELMPDGVHPNEVGAKMLAERVYGAITGDYGGLKMGTLYGDGMVLQRGAATRIEGRGDAGRDVKISLSNGVKAVAKVGDDGGWSVTLPLTKVERSVTVEIESGGVKKILKNVAVGQVWVVSGQSNMSFAVGVSANPETAVPNKNIRLFRCNPTFELPDSLSADQLEQLNELDFIQNSGWTVADKDPMSKFSAVGYYFAQMLSDSLKGEPVGLIQTSLGGAPAESFVSRVRLENGAWICDILYSPRENPMVMRWCRELAASNLRGATDPLQRHYYEPAYLYESRTVPLAVGDVAGVLWYQGESNADNAELHERLFPQVVGSFRDAYRNDSLPFYFVQLADYSLPSWPHFRKTQKELADKIENCEMVVSMDYGDPNDIHPRRKQPLGERLARLVLTKLF